MRFDEDTLRAAAAAAHDLAAPVHHLLAVAEVESAGRVFATVDGRQEPLIRFEGHWFYRRIVPALRAKAVNAGLAAKKAGAVKNPASQQKRWDLLLKPAAELDRQAAYESTSWGLGQVMGGHWKALRYPSVLALVNEARSGAAGQIALMARFIGANPAILKALRDGDWPAFARGYNGPGYKANAYDTKMRAAAAKWKGEKIPDAAKPAGKPADAQEPPDAPTPPPKAEPSPARPAGAKAAKTGLFAGLAAGLATLFYAGACHLPGWFIEWAGYAARCTGVN